MSDPARLAPPFELPGWSYRREPASGSFGELFEAEAREAARFVATRVEEVWSKRSVRIATPPLLIAGVVMWMLVHQLYFDRTNLPDLAAFLRFEPPTVGEVYDSQGEVLMELAH